MQFLCQEMEQLNLYGTVDCCICALGQFESSAGRPGGGPGAGSGGAGFGSGGVLIFDVNTVYKHRQILGDNTFVYEDEDSFLCGRTTWKAIGWIIPWTCLSAPTHRTSISEMERSFPETAYSPKEMAEMLEQAGLVCVQTFDER